jgi:hypothetical protein
VARKKNKHLVQVPGWATKVEYFTDDGIASRLALTAEVACRQQESFLMSMVRSPDCRRSPGGLLPEPRPRPESQGDEGIRMVVWKGEGFTYVGWDWVYVEAGGLNEAVPAKHKRSGREVNRDLTEEI